IFEKLKSSGKLQHINNLRAFSVKILRIKYILNNGIESPINECYTYFDGEKLLLVGNWDDITSAIAEELKKYLNLDEKFEDNVENIFDLKLKKIEQRFEKNRWGPLPAKELEWILNRTDDTPHIPPVPPPPIPPGTPFPGRPPGPIPPSPPPGPRPKPGDGDPPPRPIWTPTKRAEDISLDSIIFRDFQPQVKKEPRKPGGDGGPTGRTPGFKDTLTKEERDAIGEEGEKCAVRALLKKKMMKYPEAEIEHVSEDHYRLLINQEVISEIHRLNRPGHNQPGYDIEVKDRDLTEFIEVKSTKDKSKDQLQITQTQWFWAQEKGDLFHICRVCNTGQENPEITIITNPCKKLDDEELDADFNVLLYI
ncbi:MAG: DUF3883 domain-containing protein, partial [Ignavibacteria bacterium]|nr:DUF3883 domain-containing protein [Ignavibacteria bacterium]